MFYRSFHHAEDTFIPQAETVKLGGALRVFWMRLKRLKMYICVGLAAIVLTSFVTAGATVAFECRLTACVQVSALLNTKAFNSHKLGTGVFSRTALRMSLFSNTVMITIHPVRKYGSFTQYKTISCFYLVGFCLSVLQECHVGCKWFCWKPLFDRKQHTYRQELMWFTEKKMQMFDSADRPYEFIFKN